MARYKLALDMDNWLHDSRIAERGFIHRWQSEVAAGNGEDAFITLVDQHLRPDSAVLDVGCGHGELTLNLAARCRAMIGIERIPEYLELAKELAAERNVPNVRFFQVNLAGPDEEDRPFAGIPLPDESIDLFINRRGPLLCRYLDEAMRVARPGAVLVGLHPAGNAPAPPWRDELPQAYQGVFMTLPMDEVKRWVTAPLEKAGISDYSLWWIDVPEFLRDPHELYVRLSLPLPGEAGAPGAPEYRDIEGLLGNIFERHSTPRGIILRQQRLLWQAYLPKYDEAQAKK